MDLSDEAPSKNSRDATWYPHMDGRWKDFQRLILAEQLDRPSKKATYGQHDSSLTGQPYGNLTPNEIDMHKAGADLREIMFMRLMNEKGQPGYISPVENPNR